MALYLHAQDAPYWGTDVAASKSQADILKILDKLGADKAAVQIQRVKNQDKVLVVVFEWPRNTGVFRRFEFPRLPFRKPKYASHTWQPTEKETEQCQKQAARIGYYMLKNLVTFMNIYPHLLTGFTEIPQAGTREDGLSLLIGDIEQDKFLKSLPQNKEPQ